jgi:prophage antirepressor-like protein
MNDIAKFTNKEFGTVQVIELDGEPMFVGKDVATMLGYALPTKAINEHVDIEDRKVLEYKAFSKTEKASLWQGNDYSDKTLINESGLYSLILSSKLEGAKRFKRWVTSEVLPSIRKTGSYYVPRTFAQALRLAAEQQEKIEEQQKLLELQAPKVEYHDAVLASVSTYTTTQIAKEMGMSATALNKKLHELGVQYYQNGSWLLYAKYQDKGFTESETIKFNSKKGDTITKMVFKWTEEGRKFIHEKICGA